MYLQERGDRNAQHPTWCCAHASANDAGHPESGRVHQDAPGRPVEASAELEPAPAGGAVLHAERRQPARTHGAHYCDPTVTSLP